METEAVYRIARKAVRSVVARGYYPIYEDDFKDMIQEASIEIIKTEGNKPGMDEGYYFVAARCAAMNWLIWWRYGIGYDKARGLLGIIKSPVSISDLDEKELIVQNTDKPENILDSRQTAIMEIFWRMRTKHTKRDFGYMLRDVQICCMLAKGHSSQSISIELGINYHSVCRFRQNIRRYLIKYLERNLLATLQT